MTRKIGYAFVVGDLLHYGHLHFLMECKNHCDYLIVGVYTDELTATYKRTPIIPYAERVAMIKALRIVDQVETVYHRNPARMLKRLHVDDGLKIDFLFHGNDWVPRTDSDMQKGKDYIESIGGKLIQPKYYMGRSTTSIVQAIVEKRKLKVDTEIKTDMNLREFRTINGQRIVHSWAELYFIEQILSNNQFRVLIEIGAYLGGLSLYFGLHALRMGGESHSFDILPEPLFDNGLYSKLKPTLPISYYELDAYSEQAQEIVERVTVQGRSLIYCDGGERLRGFRIYAKLLKIDDVIMVHDTDNSLSFEQAYAREIHGKDVCPFLDEFGLEPFFREEVNQLGAVFSFIKVK